MTRFLEKNELLSLTRGELLDSILQQFLDTDEYYRDYCFYTKHPLKQEKRNAIGNYNDSIYELERLLEALYIKDGKRKNWSDYAKGDGIFPVIHISVWGKNKEKIQKRIDQLYITPSPSPPSSPSPEPTVI